MNVASSSQRLLRNALLANAVYSLLSAVIIVGWHHRLVRLLGIPRRFNPISLAFALASSPFGCSSVLSESRSTARCSTGCWHGPRMGDSEFSGSCLH